MEKVKPKNNLKKAVVDQILLWTVLFVGFVTLLFITIDYSSILRLNNNNDALAQQGARMIALGLENDEVATSLNNLRNDYYAVITEADINCVEVTDTSYQVIFNVISTYEDAKVLTFENNINASSSSFNETSSNEITCTLTLSKN